MFAELGWPFGWAVWLLQAAPAMSSLVSQRHLLPPIPWRLWSSLERELNPTADPDHRGTLYPSTRSGELISTLGQVLHSLRLPGQRTGHSQPLPKQTPTNICRGLEYKSERKQAALAVERMFIHSQ